MYVCQSFSVEPPPLLRNTIPICIAPLNPSLNNDAVDSWDYTQAHMYYIYIYIYGIYLPYSQAIYLLCHNIQ